MIDIKYWYRKHEFDRILISVLRKRWKYSDTYVRQYKKNSEHWFALYFDEKDNVPIIPSLEATAIGEAYMIFSLRKQKCRYLH